MADRIDSKAFDTIREVSERTLKGKKEQKRDKDMLGGTWRSEEDKNKFLANRQKLYAAYDKETEKLWRKAKTEIGMDKAGKVFPTLHRCAELGRVHVHHGKTSFSDIPRF